MYSLLLNGNTEKNKIDKYLQILLLSRQIYEKFILSIILIPKST